MKNNIKHIINLECLKKIVLILLITYALYFILIQHNITNIDNDLESFSDSLSIFGDNLDFEYSAGVIYKRINKIISNKIKGSTLEEIKSSEPDENGFSINHRNIPIGLIRYFPFQLPSTEYDSWLLCNGTSRIGSDYPELFRLLNNRPPNGTEEFSVPNLVCRTIIGRRFNRSPGSPDISPIGGSGGKFMNPSNSNYYTDLKNSPEAQDLESEQRKKLRDLGIDSALFKLASGSSTGIIYNNLGTDGVDGCPETQNSKEGDSDDWYYCLENDNTPPNLPPYIALYPYIKAKTVKYKFNIP